MSISYAKLLNLSGIMRTVRIDTFSCDAYLNQLVILTEGRREDKEEEMVRGNIQLQCCLFKILIISLEVALTARGGKRIQQRWFRELSWRVRG